MCYYPKNVVVHIIKMYSNHQIHTEERYNEMNYFLPNCNVHTYVQRGLCHVLKKNVQSANTALRTP